MASGLKNPFASHQHKAADDFDLTIANILVPDRLKDLCPAMPDAPDFKQDNLGEQLFKIRLAQSDAVREAATLLVLKRDAVRGYKAGEIHQEPNRITLLAHQGDEVVGSLNIGYDSPEGLCADARYRQEIDALRAQGCIVGEITKLAIDENMGYKQVLAGMINIAYLYGLIHGVTDAVIEVTQRHRSFYERMLDFRQIGGERFYAASNTHVVLMHVKLAHITERIESVGGKRSACKERSIYPYFFRPKDQEGIMQRLRGEG
ncbi:MAG: N-acetyltransferase [Rubrivivax sp.]|nr:N-acetyltransferase [Rubrivivax sp.]